MITRTLWLHFVQNVINNSQIIFFSENFMSDTNTKKEYKNILYNKHKII